MHLYKKLLEKEITREWTKWPVNLPYKRLEFLGFQPDDKVIAAAAAGGNCHIANGNNLFLP